MGLYLSKPDGTSSQPLPDEFTRRIVILGKTGAGKSTLINTLLGRDVCKADNSPESGTRTCQVGSGIINGKCFTFIDTPGFFDTRCEEEMKSEIMSSIIECSPGPHVFIIVLKVEKFTEQEKDVIKKVTDYFSHEALKFATVLFTHGDQLHDGVEIEQFVSQSKELSQIVKMCGNRCNVFDNKYWKNLKEGEDKYRNNNVQLKKLLDTIDKIIEANNENYFSHEMLQKVATELKEEKKRIEQENPNLSPQEVTQEAKNAVHKKFLTYLVRTTSEILFKSFLGREVLQHMQAIGVGVAITNLMVVAAKRGAGAVESTDADTTRLSSTAASAEKTSEDHEAVAHGEVDSADS